MDNAINSTPVIYDGKVKTLFKIALFNVCLTILTLGIYSFWGKSNLRRYIVSSFRIKEDRFEYTGNGRELFRGFLKVLFFYIIPFLALDTLLKFLSLKELPENIITLISCLDVILNISFSILFFLGIYYAGYSSLRYRISRVQWRGIESKLTSTFSHYTAIILGNKVYNLITLGLGIPHSDHDLTCHIVKHLSIGNLNSSFDGDYKSLSRINFVTLFLFVPTFGISRIWYRAALNRYRFNHLQIGPLKFSNTQTGWDLFKLSAGNLIIFLLTAGLGSPFIYHRQSKFLARHTLILGSLDLELLQINPLAIDGSGEILSEILDSELDVAFF